MNSTSDSDGSFNRKHNYMDMLKSDCNVASNECYQYIYESEQFRSLPAQNLKFNYQN